MINDRLTIAFKICLLYAIIPLSINAQVSAPAAQGPIPTANQLRWQQMEYYAFIHFSTNTFTDQEWGYGEPADAKLFNPKELDCEQWSRVCKQSGMKGIIITAKHHSGFCLWPTSTTDYSIKNSPWKDGKGDIVGDLAKACRKYGLKLGIYISPWDRNSPLYGKLNADGTAPYVTDIFRKQIEECLTKYGDIFEIWFDGANGGDGYYGGERAVRKIDRTSYYDWQNTYKMIRRIQPKIVIWNDNGDRADLRWVGTESGYVGETNWSLLNSKGDVPEEMLRYGVENGNAWVPGEVNTSIRPGWFYHAREDHQVKNVARLMDTYYKSIGRNGTFLLNFPIDRRGLIHEADEKAAHEMIRSVREAFANNLALKAKITASSVRGKDKRFGASNVNDQNTDTYWATDDDTRSASLLIDLGSPVNVNRVVAQEYIALGQRVRKFRLEALLNGKWVEIKDQLVAEGKDGLTTIGYKRIISFPTIKTSQIRFSIVDAKACPLIAEIGVFNAPQILMAPLISRNRNGDIRISPVDTESEIYYTVDGSNPTNLSLKYTEALKTDGRKINVRAISYDRLRNKFSSVTEEVFDIAKTKWSIVDNNDPKSAAVMDGDEQSAFYIVKPGLPADLVIDLGENETVNGFRYLPGPRSNGIITQYEIYLSEDNKVWRLVDKGEFSNILNNPLMQTKRFDAKKARYIKFRAIKASGDAVGYAEVDIITQ